MVGVAVSVGVGVEVGVGLAVGVDVGVLVGVGVTTSRQSSGSAILQQLSIGIPPPP